MTDTLIEVARPRDLRRMQELIRELSAFHGDEAQVTLEQLQGIFFGSNPKGIAFLAREGSETVGYAGVLETVAVHSAIPRFDIHHLHVVETRRSRGVGRKLIAAAKNYATMRGARGLTIGTDPRNATAQAAYRAMGLEEITDAGPRFWIEITTDTSGKVD
ncbi:GNAT family N-acetyltransferase [Yoonia sp. F2084L]|uniref:GNAT family N-acetyltransferase n=1 Tax=Yoonia sp. F2084L TaxID=2926419 RepID=UPI001FF41A3E|nr:GNAT family N-acetyltransferase [Yoonia sp. F2084L]MCK0096435.1 GNAT family N-acetyltransferase [Yoonia sp. F2084L]